MNNLGEFLATGRQRAGASMLELKEQETPHVTTYQAFVAAEKAEKARPDQSPLVMWAKKHLNGDVAPRQVGLLESS